MSDEPRKPLRWPEKPTIQPRNHFIFDPFQSTSTGHQVANQGYTAHGTTEWRNLRAAKLGNQFKNGDCIQEHDQNEALVGSTTRGPLLAPGAFDGRVQPQSPTGTSGERAGATEATARQNRTGLRDIRSFLGVSKRKAVDDRQEAAEKADKKAKYTEKHSHIGVHKKLQPESDSGVGRSGLSLGLKAKPDIFAGVKIFINGSTLLQISDHKLKQDLTNNGAHCAIHMDGTVTHILVGRPNAAGSGAGGGLAARKLQELIARGGKGVKVVSVDWAIESISEGRRQAESRFPGMCVAAQGQRSVTSMFGTKVPSRTKK